MAAYSIADEPAVTPNVAIQDIQEEQQQNQQQPKIETPSAPPPNTWQEAEQQQARQRPPQPPPQQQPQQQGPPQWTQANQQALDKLSTSEQAIQSRVVSGEYDPKEPGVQQMMGAIQKQKGPLMQQKQAAQAAQSDQQVQGAMKQAAVQASIENVHRVERAKVFEQGVGSFTDAETGSTEHFYEAKPGDWKPIEWKKQQAQSDTEPAIYNQMTGQEYQQSLGTPGGNQAAQRIGQSLGQGQPGEDDDMVVPKAQRDAIRRDANRIPQAPRTGNPRVDANAAVMRATHVEQTYRQGISDAAKRIRQERQIGESVEARESRAKIEADKLQARRDHDLKQKDSFWDRFTKTHAMLTTKDESGKAIHPKVPDVLDMMRQIEEEHQKQGATPEGMLGKQAPAAPAGPAGLPDPNQIGQKMWKGNFDESK